MCPISCSERIAVVNLMRSPVVSKVSWRKNVLDGCECLIGANDGVNALSEVMKERRN
jgi:hypothetical protein